jgi:putative ABC transport system permease protein
LLSSTFNILVLAAKHAWRHRRRTLLVGVCVALGNAVLIFQLAQGRGQEKAFINNMINSLSGHLQINQKGEEDASSLFEANIQKMVPIKHVEQLEIELLKHPEIQAITQRVRFGGMISRDEENWNGFIVGVQAENERKVCDGIQLAQGQFVTSGKNEIVISMAVARERNLSVGDNLTILASTTSRSFNAMEFKISGLLADSGLSKFYSRMAYIPIDRAQKLIGLEKNQAFELVLRLKETSATIATGNRLISQFQAAGYDLKINTWQDLGGIFLGIIEVSKAFRIAMILFLAVIILILIFSSFSIYVFERRREIATLLALGMLKKELMTLFLAEAGLVAIVSACFGLIVGGGSSLYFGEVGIPAFNEAMTYVFAGDKLYPIFKLTDAFLLLFGSCVIAMFATLIPVGKTISRDFLQTLNRN